MFFLENIHIYPQELAQIQQARTAVRQILADAKFQFYLCYTENFHVSKNSEHAMQLLQEAASMGDQKAQCILGVTYQLGDSLPKDLEKAIFWYQQAAEQGNVTAQFFLAGCFRKGGVGVSPNGEKAFFWFAKAALQGYADAQYCLGTCYADGTGVPKDPEKAFFWYTKAAEQGNAKSQFYLAFMYFIGKELYRNGKNIADGQNFDVHYLLKLPRNVEKAFFWAKKAAEQDLPEAQTMLGLFYFHGIAVAKDKQKALFWIGKAALKDFESALEWLEQNHYSLSEVKKFLAGESETLP